MSTEKELMIELLIKQTGKTKEEVSEMIYEGEGDEVKLKENALNILADVDAARVTSIKDGVKNEWETKLEKVKNDQFGLGKKEGLKALEESLIKEFQVDAGDKKGIDLVKAIVAKNTKSSLSADDIKKTNEYLELESRLNSDYIEKAEYEKAVNDLQEFKSNIERERTQGAIREKASKYFYETKPKLFDDKQKAEAQKKMFMKTFVDGLNIDTSTDEWILLESDGKRKENAHGQPITFKSYIEENVKASFEILVQSAGGGAGNTGGGSGGGSELKEPETESEFTSEKRKLKGRELVEYHNKWCEKFDLAAFNIPQKN